MSAFEPIRYAALTDVGVKRSHNQDACAAQPAADATGWIAHGHVFVVADGMGGHAVGEKASAKAVRDIPFLYLRHVSAGTINAIRQAFQETNRGIFTVGQENPEFRGLGTTSTALFLRPEGAWVGHVGDSRAYRIRDGIAEQLTFDHSWVWEIARRQGVDPDELGDFKKNVIIRSLGPDPDVDVDVEGPYPVHPGDTYLLCSDGLTGVVTPEDIGAVAANLPTDEAARLLVNLANIRGGPDNITVLIVHVGDNSTDPSSRKSGRGVVGKLINAWNRRVPWPFTALGAGSALAGLSLLLRTNEIAGAAFLFGFAAIVILAGLTGLVIQFRREPNEMLEAEDAPRTLNYYKKHRCEITPALLEKFAQLELSLVQAMKSQEVNMDWDRYNKLADTADGLTVANREIDAFRARCGALLFISEAFHKARQKEESFRPSWTTSPHRNGPHK